MERFRPVSHDLAALIARASQRDAAALQRLYRVLRERPVILYGAGKIAERVHAVLSRHGVQTERVWDLNASALQDRIEGVPIEPPNVEGIPVEDRRRYVVIVTIFAHLVNERVRSDLRAAGFANTFGDRSFLNALLHGDCQSARLAGSFDFNLKQCHLCPVQRDEANPCRIFEEEVTKRYVKGRPTQHRNAFIIRSMGVLISNKCNLTCVGCNHLRDHYKPSDNIDLEAAQVLRDLERITDAVDMIKTLVLVGGEAFLHRQVGPIIRRLLELPRVGILHIITNGTVLPKSDDVYELLRDPRIFVEISGYGPRISQHLQIKRSQFIEQLATNDISYRYVEQLQWTDFGGFENRGYTEREIEAVYSSCCFVSNDLFDGKLHKCSRSAYGNLIGKIPDYPSDYVDVRAGRTEALRERLIGFFADRRPRVCLHCNGTSAKTIEAGRQVERAPRRSAALVTAQ